MTIFSAVKCKWDCVKIASLTLKWERIYESVTLKLRKLRFSCDYSDCNTDDEKIFKDEMLAVVDGTMALIKDLKTRYRQPSMGVIAMPFSKLMKIKKEEISNPISEFYKGWGEVKKLSLLLNKMVAIWANKDSFEITICKEDEVEEGA